MVLRRWSKQSAGDLKLYRPQEAEEAGAKLRATRRWTQRCLVKSGLEAAYLLAYGAPTPKETAPVEATELVATSARTLRPRR
jgi:hypothetical protein